MSAPGLAITAGDATLVVLPSLGSAWESFSWRGQPVLRPTANTAVAESNVRATAGYPLVPYSNRIADATLTFRGRRYELARNFGAHPHSIHGLGWQRAWRVVRHRADSLQLALAHDTREAQDRAAWPWPFDCVHTMRLAARADGAAVLTATLLLRSRAHEAFPFGLGWHPFFPTTAATTLAFEARGVWLNGPTQLPVEHVVVPPDWSFARPRPIDLELDQVFTGWSGAAVLCQPSAGLRVTMEADSASTCLVVYSPAARDDVALEPVTHETDAFNRAEAGASGTGMRILPPGGAFSCTMRLTVAPLA